MDQRKDIYLLWLQYTTQNEKSYFWQFIARFVEIWENQIDLNWSEPPHWKDAKPEAVPSLSKLPDELLAAIGKFLFIAREDSLKDDPITEKNIHEVSLLLRCLLVISRNFDNIPFVASCDYVKFAAPIILKYVQIISNSDVSSKENFVNTVLLFCNFLEALYDPYLTWRNYLLNRLANVSQLQFRPSLLHVEVIPFIYDCFETNVISSCPRVGIELLHSLGSAISGAQHNALRAVCPATVNLVLKIISTVNVDDTLRETALQCFTIMVHILYKFSPDQRQIELSMILQMYRDSLKDFYVPLIVTGDMEFSRGLRSRTRSSNISKDESLDRFISTDISNRLLHSYKGSNEIENRKSIKLVNYESSNAIHALVHTIRTLLDNADSNLEAISQMLVDLNFIQILMSVPEECGKRQLYIESIGVECVKTLSKLVQNCQSAKEKIKINGGLDHVVRSIMNIQTPTREILQEFLLLAKNGNQPSDMDVPLGNAEVVVSLIRDLDVVEDDDQIWLALEISNLCTYNLPSKYVACKEGVIMAICKLLSNNGDSMMKCVNMLINLLDELSCVSISPKELKQVFLLLRPEIKISYKMHLLHALGHITRASSTQIRAYLDIYRDVDGIVVPNIGKWSNFANGFAFHCWLRMNRLPDHERSISKRRQVLILLTQSGQGLEAFVDQSGILVVAVATRKEYLLSTVTSVNFDDNCWHCVSICLVPARRAFAHNHVNVFVDGSQRLGVSMKFSVPTEPYRYCVIGAPITQATGVNSNMQENDKVEPGKGMLPSILENVFQPFSSVQLQIPQYFSLRSSTMPGVRNLPLGAQNTVCGPQGALKGHVAHVSLYSDTLTPAVAKWLYEAGPECHSLLSSDESLISQELYGRLVFCYSALAVWEGTCLDLSLQNNFSALCSAMKVQTYNIKDTINGVGGIQVLFPLLELAMNDMQFLVNTFQPPPSPSPEASHLNDWELLPSNAHTERKLDSNPVSMFLTLIKNMMFGNVLNQEELLKDHGVTILGSLLLQCNTTSIDVNVLIAVQLLVEIARDMPNILLLEAFYQSIVFNFEIWSKALFHIRIGHIQYITTLIKEDRKYFRNHYGVQFFFDIIRQCNSADGCLSDVDAKTIRLALLSIIRYFISKEISIKEVHSILGFLLSVKEEILIIETLEMLTTYMDSKTSKDQIFLLMHEPNTAETLLGLLSEGSFSVSLKMTLVRFFGVLLSTDCISTHNKLFFRLQSGNVSLYAGLIGSLKGQEMTVELACSLFDVICIGETSGGYAGVLSMLHLLSQAEIDIKLGLARKMLTLTFINSQSLVLIAKNVGWQECIVHLLIKRPISTSGDLVEEAIELTWYDVDKSEVASSHHLQLPSLSEAASVIENEIKDLAGSVSDVVVGNLQHVAGNLQHAAGNISSAMANVSSLVASLDLPDLHNLTPWSQTTSDTVSLGETESDVLSSLTSSAEDEPSEKIKFFDAPLSSEIKRQLDEMEASENCVNKEDNLCFLVANILFSVLWKGIEGSDKNAWKERGQVIASINLLALNNELYCSHLQLRLRLLELSVQAALNDLSEMGVRSATAQENAYHLIRLVYDLVVLDQNEDESKKCSNKLLDGVLSLLDAMQVFTESAISAHPTGSGSLADAIARRTRIRRVGAGVLCEWSCMRPLPSQSSPPRRLPPSLAAPAAARLHALVRSSPAPANADVSTSGQTGTVQHELPHLMYEVSVAIHQAVSDGNIEQYSFLMPVMKALLEKLYIPFGLSQELPELPKMEVGPSFYVGFQVYCMGEEWRRFIETKILPLHKAYENETMTLICEPLNTYWAECYEACKIAAAARARTQRSADAHFQAKILATGRSCQSEDTSRFAAALAQRRSRELAASKRWHCRRDFFFGPRGAWRASDQPPHYWRLSPHENRNRMRPKLERWWATEEPQPHVAAARLRDNLGRSAAVPADATPHFGASVARALRPIAASADHVSEDELRMSAEPEPIPKGAGKEKLVISHECELITLMSKIAGRVDITTSHIYFHDLSPAKEEGERRNFSFPLTHLRQIHLRRYNLRRSALELFMMDHTNYFLNFTTKTRNKVFTRILSLQPQNILYGSGRSPAELLKASGLTQKWVNREITNFDYLMQLNTIAGRSYNDLSQYPVFPWILADYHSNYLDLEKAETFRDLSKPIGVVNPKNEAEVRAKYENFEDPSGVISKFHYGTHYSNSAGVLHFLIRIEPFTSLHIDLQSGRFDIADRQFHSIAQTWKLLMDNPNDVKELTPEFFYFAEFLQNVNGLDLGVLQGTSQRVEDVILPPWAGGSAENFVHLHRQALESDFVSANLHNWIDLVFGYKQKGPKAVEALNVFYYCSYEGAVDLDAITDDAERMALEGMIDNFGQTPAQLMRTAHPVRLGRNAATARALRLAARTADILSHLQFAKVTLIPASRNDDPAKWLGGPARAKIALLGGVRPRAVVAVTKGRQLLQFAWQPNADIPLDVPPEYLIPEKKKSQVGVESNHASVIDSRALAITSDGKVLYTGGHWDCSLRGYSISNKVKLLFTVTKHFDFVTCLALDSCTERWLVSGSADGTCWVWELTSGNSGSLTSSSTSLAPTARRRLHGHDAPLTCVAVMAELDVVASGAKDGTVNIYTLKSGEYIHTLNPQDCVGPEIHITFLVITPEGHIGFIAKDETFHTVHVYGVNGSWRGSRRAAGRVTSLAAAPGHVLIADDAGDLTISSTHGLKPVYDVPLHVPIEHVLVMPNTTHILVALRDGQVAIIHLSLDSEQS